MKKRFELIVFAFIIHRHEFIFKLDAENKRKSYSKLVREINQHKLEEQKRIQNNSGQERTRTYVAPTLRRRRVEFINFYLDRKFSHLSFFFSQKH
jgi:ribosomal 50S subunit-associated protein YjgA (DUF615 family)